MNHSAIDTHDRDAPIFAPDAFRLGDEEAALIDKARRFGARVLAPRAAQHDRDATFPIENFRDMHPEGLLAHLRAEAAWRARRLVPHLLPRRRRARPLLRRDRAVLEHACVLHAVDRRARRRSGDERGGARRAQCARAPTHYRAHRRERRDLLAAVLRRRRGRRGRGGVRHRGEAGRRRLSGQRQEDLRLALRRRRLLRHPLHRARRRRSRRAAATRSISRSRRTRRASASSATGTRSACAARSRARC